MTTLPGGLSRWEGMQAMLKADSGKIEEMEKVGTEKLVALVIEPIGKGEFVTSMNLTTPSTPKHTGPLCSLTV